MISTTKASEVGESSQGDRNEKCCFRCHLQFKLLISLHRTHSLFYTTSSKSTYKKKSPCWNHKVKYLRDIHYDNQLGKEKEGKKIKCLTSWTNNQVPGQLLRLCLSSHKEEVLFQKRKTKTAKFPAGAGTSTGTEIMVLISIYKKSYAR